MCATRNGITFLSIVTNHNLFFSKLTVNDIFTYSSAYLFDEVAKIAERRCLSIKYCNINSLEYKKYGDRTAKVIEDRLNIEKIFHFDPEFLDI